MTTVRLLKMAFLVHCDFTKGSQNRHLHSITLVGRNGVIKATQYTWVDAEDASLTAKVLPQ